MSFNECNLPQKIARFLMGYLLTIGAIFGTQWTYYNYFDQYELPTITQPVKILNENKEVAVGETILMELEVYKPQDLRADGSVNITCDDGNLVTIQSKVQAQPIGEYTIIDDRYQLPNKVSVGATCQFNGILDFEVNPYITETLVYSSEQFTVKE